MAENCQQHSLIYGASRANIFPPLPTKHTHARALYTTAHARARTYHLGFFIEPPPPSITPFYPMHSTPIYICVIYIPLCSVPARSRVCAFRFPFYNNFSSRVDLYWLGTTENTTIVSNVNKFVFNKRNPIRGVPAMIYDAALHTLAHVVL